MSFGENLLRIRKSKGISQAQLGEMIGLTQQAISKYESGERLHRGMDASHIRKIESGRTKPNETTIERIASALECTVGELFGEEKVIPCKDCLWFDFAGDAPFPHGFCMGYFRKKMVKTTDFCSRAKPYDEKVRTMLDEINNMSDGEFIRTFIRPKD